MNLFLFAGKLEKTKSKLSLKLFKSRSAKSSIRVCIFAEKLFPAKKISVRYVTEYRWYPNATNMLWIYVVMSLILDFTTITCLQVLIIVGVFLVCVGPILILGLVAYISEKFISLRAAFLVYILSLSHSAINPVVYGLFDIRFR